MAKPPNPDTEKLKDLLSKLDESIIANAVADSGREDLKEALEKKGIKIKLTLIEKPFWKSKKFWGGIIALVIILLDPIFPDAELWQVALPILVYIFGQGLADLGKNKPTPA